MKQLHLALMGVSILIFAFASKICFSSEKKTLVPQHEVMKTKNGVEVLFFPSPNIPLFDVSFVYGSGSEIDPEQKSGIGNFSVAMIKHGFAGLNENMISRKEDDLATSIDASVREDEVTISTYGLNEHAPEILDLFFQAVSAPTFPEAPFKRIKTNQIDAMLQMVDSAHYLGGQVLEDVIFNGTPRARSPLGLLAELKKLSLEDVKRYYPKLIRTDLLKVLVIGGTDHSIVDRVIRGIEALPCSECAKPVSQSRPWTYSKWKVSKGKALLVKRPGLSEAHVFMGFRGPKRLVPEFYDLRVAETILSGVYASKLNLIIREKMNLTYTISADFDFAKNYGLFYIVTSTRNEKSGILIKTLRGLLSDFVEGRVGKPGAVTQEDVQMAKDYLIGSFPLGLENMYSIAHSYFRGVNEGLSPDFLDVYRDKIRAVTLQSMQAAVKKYFHLNQLVTVVVGDEKVLDSPLRKSGIVYEVKNPNDFL